MVLVQQSLVLLLMDEVQSSKEKYRVQKYRAAKGKYLRAGREAGDDLVSMCLLLSL